MKFNYFSILESYAQKRVDREKGIVYKVRICGPKSANGWIYPKHSRGILKDLYEGFTVKWDHLFPGQKSSSSRQAFAVIKNVVNEDAGTYGDMYLFHPNGSEEQRFLGAAEQGAKGIGLSHHVQAHKEALKKNQDGTVIVDLKSKDQVRLMSIDLVENPATGTSIFESEAHMAEGLVTITEQDAEATDWKQMMAAAAAAAIASGDPDAHDLGMKVLKLLKPKAQEEATDEGGDPEYKEPGMESTQTTPKGFVSITESTLDKIAKGYGVKLTPALKKAALALPMEAAIEILESMKPVKTTINQHRKTEQKMGVPSTLEERKARYQTR